MPKTRSSKTAAQFREAADPPKTDEQANRHRRQTDFILAPGDDRLILIHGAINAELARMVTGRLLAIGEKYANETAEEKARKPILLVIDSPGGSVHAGMSIYDMMNHVQARFGIPVGTVGLGANMSMASFLLCAGTPGYRSMMPNSDHMIHEPSGGGGGRATTHDVANATVQEVKERMIALYRVHTNMTYTQIRKLFDHTDDYLRPEECVKRGIVDFIRYPDAMMQEIKDDPDKKVAYAPGIEEHLNRISMAEREMNTLHGKSRTASPGKGLYQNLKID